MAEIAAVVERLEDTDLSACAAGDLEGLVAESARARSWLDSFDARVAKRNRELTNAGREANANLLGNNGRRSSREARDAAERAETCEQIPELGDALESGDCTSGHVDAVTRATADADDKTRERVAECGDAIAAAAKNKTPEQLGREVRDLVRNCSDDDGLSEHERRRKQRRVRRWRNRETGMRVTQLELDDETDAKVWTAISAAVRRRRAESQDDGLTFDQLQADAVVDLLLNGGGDGAGGVPEITVVIDWQTLRDGAHEGGVCETGDGVALPVETVRRLCCDAQIVPVVLGGRGEVLDLGRAERTANREQRRALRAMYRHCVFAGCTVGFEQCRIHHVRYWFDGGASDLDNLLPLCEQHHHAVHDGGFCLELFPGDDGRRMRITSPTGKTIFDGPSITRTPTDTIPTPTAAPEREPNRSEPASVPRDDRVGDGEQPGLFEPDSDALDDELVGLGDAELLDAMTGLLSDDDDVDGRGLRDALTIAMARGHLETRGVLTDEQTSELRELYRRYHRPRRRRTRPAQPAPPVPA